MSSLASDYYTRSNELLARAWSTNTPVIERLAPVLGKLIADGKVLHAFGSGHSEMIAREIIGRAGGLVAVSAVIDPAGGAFENLSDYGTKLIEKYERQYKLLAGEAILVVSNSGRNASPIDVALHARQRGLTVIALTSVEVSRSAPSQHKSQQRLFEAADFVLDNCGVSGDAIVAVAGGINAGPTSTFIGCSLLNRLMLATIDWLKANGHPLPILRSQNIPGAIEHNRTLAEKYRARLSHQLA